MGEFEKRVKDLCFELVQKYPWRSDRENICFVSHLKVLEIIDEAEEEFPKLNTETKLYHWREVNELLLEYYKWGKKWLGE